ncbi:hypothetical protein NFI96_002801 [Prochilodus magdalenae]|nr:hypothetical protein NFI96_002801 [Prochilodus magdalenae]
MLIYYTFIPNHDNLAMILEHSLCTRHTVPRSELESGTLGLNPTHPLPESGGCANVRGVWCPFSAVQRPVGSVPWAASCGQRPVGQRPVPTDEGLEDDQHCTVQQQMSYRL